MKRFHRQCYRRLDLYDLQLKKMQDAYTTAHLRLEIYQSLMRALAAANNKADHARLRWTQEKISEAMQQVEANNPTAQHLLAAEKKYDRCALKKILC
ncbi:hypothetical protein [Chryseosolibacter histidini]|uniref:hypothetical protein n=1 Tax=Chryseosolibacter histidini TaxID=2782349 RepID=UPI0020B29744|nr:hypothetical protein [Chryseosolibacter histidini]